jgi:hypothetical protein
MAFHKSDTERFAPCLPPGIRWIARSADTCICDTHSLRYWQLHLRHVILISPRVALAAANKRGVTYSRSATGTGMPSWNAFRHVRRGVSSALSMVSKLPVLLRTAAEATQIECCVFSGRYCLADVSDSTTNAGLVQARFPGAIF